MSHEKSQLTSKEIETLRVELERKRGELVRARDRNLEAGTHDDERHADPMDAATRAQDEAELLGLASQERALLADIDRALAKIAAGTYGKSELSERPISLGRLRAVPWARLTAEEEEDRARSR